jgi:hypothetical protein
MCDPLRDGRVPGSAEHMDGVGHGGSLATMWAQAQGGAPTLPPTPRLRIELWADQTLVADSDNQRVWANVAYLLVGVPQGR